MDDKEKRFEADIEASLLSQGGYIKGDPAAYDKEKAMDLATLISFVKVTQPKEWTRFGKQCASDVEKKFYKAVNDAID
jgi:type I restriction enzyme R subunit